MDESENGIHYKIEKVQVLVATSNDRSGERTTILIAAEGK
jgi:hypothetical protein